ncbi:MAG TPA: hypothetical protein VLW52_05220 [Opitutaceae bacterium]|nr:hypothetical protein [Opitutaceae bacterium]
MPDPSQPKSRTRLMRWKGWLAVGILAATAITLARWVQPFLAISWPVPADVLVVEGWVPDYVLAAAAREFRHGHYTRLLVSGLAYDRGPAGTGEKSYAREAAEQLATLGIDRSLIVACPGPGAEWNRTSHSVRVVRDRLRALGITPQGINVMTLGPHARQTLLAYRRLIDPTIPVGVISIPKDDYDPARWWASRAGIKKVTKDLAGWVRELLFGLRS